MRPLSLARTLGLISALFLVLAPLAVRGSHVAVAAPGKVYVAPAPAKVHLAPGHHFSSRDRKSRARPLDRTPRRQVEWVGNRAELASRACIAFASTGPNRHHTVFVDAGHGGPDPGAEGLNPSGAPLLEKVVTLAVARMMLPLLRADGYRVVMSRITDTSVARLRPGFFDNGGYTAEGGHAEIEARIDCANAAHAQLLLAIHFDAFGDPSVGGAETAYDAVRPFHRENLRFADLVQRSILAGFQAQGWDVPDRLVHPDSDIGTPPISPQDAIYGHLLELGPSDPVLLPRAGAMPGALTEPLFLTDPAEAQIAADRPGQQVMARSLVRAIQEYFGR